MRIARLPVLVACLLFAWVPAASAVAAEAEPVALSEVGRMIDADQSPGQVLAVLVERGVGFRLTSGTVRRLERWGFTETQVGLVRKIAAGEAVDPDAMPGGAGAGGAEAGEFGVGYPNPGRWHKAEQARIERAIKNAGLGYHRIELSRCTLYCSDQRARDLAPMLRKLETALITRFPESIVNASSPQSAHIIIVDRDSAWRNWVTACFDSYEADNIRYQFRPGEDPRPQMIRGSGYVLPACAVTHADKHENDQSVARYAAFALGFLMMGQAGGEEQPDGLRTGFGNLTESMVYQTPSVMLQAYRERELGESTSWRELVAQRFNEKKIGGVASPWGYETAAMEVTHYAECWSLVATLAAAPDKFAEAVSLVRDGEKPMVEAVREAYAIDDTRLLEAWHAFVTQ